MTAVAPSPALRLVPVAIHTSQFPEQVRAELLQSLRSRQINHKFHYDSHKQTLRWLALHQAYSPSRTDPDCQTVYDQAFQAVAAGASALRVHLVGLGCGGGQKDARLLQGLHRPARQLFYSPVDVSTPMVLVARRTVGAQLPAAKCFPFVCDLATAEDLPQAFEQSHSVPPEAARLLTCFGMLPNFEPGIILPRLAALVRAEDELLFSANLSPGADYAAGLRRILPLYDNALTRDWLLTFLWDLGVEKADGELRFGIENDPAGSGLQRVGAYFHFGRTRTLQVEGETFEFSPGDSVRLFFSYRHTPALVRTLLAQHGLAVREQWITPSQEEGVFWVKPLNR